MCVNPSGLPAERKRNLLLCLVELHLCCKGHQAFNRETAHPNHDNVYALLTNVVP